MGLDQSIFRKKADGKLVEEIYWRKANFVHNYFTKDWLERGFEDDNCTEFPVDEEALIWLAEKCDYVLENRGEADAVLPTMSGFFFGSTEYGDWYFNDLQYTIDQINELLTLRPLEKGEEFFYYAWY